MPGVPNRRWIGTKPMPISAAKESSCRCSRCAAWRAESGGAGMVIEREHLLTLATEGADLAQTSFPTVNGLGCVKVLTNTYSVPLPAGAQVQAKAYASIIELWHEGRCVARHERCYR